MMCAPRSAMPEVATALSAASTTRASWPRWNGSAMPTRHGSAPDDPGDAHDRGDPDDGPAAPSHPGDPGGFAAARPLRGRPPAHWTSPPPLTRWFVDPAADKIAGARPTAQ